MSVTASDSASFLRLQALDKSFGAIQVLRSISLGLREGEILALVGPSGSGKTTLLRLLAGFEKPDNGDILVAGESVAPLPPAQRGFGMVFQHYALFPHMSVAENVAFGLESQGWSVEEIPGRVEEMLRLVDLARYGRRRVSEISGGQQQRVALARALATKPRVLLLDEPLSNLDPTLRERTRRELRQAVREVGITTVLVTHEQEEAFHLGDRVAVLHAGRLEQVGTPRELYNAPATAFVATFVGRASLLPAELLGEEEVSPLRLGNAVRWSGELVGEAEAGAMVELALRPESLRLVAEGHKDALPGTLLERRYTGPATFGTVRLLAASADQDELSPEVEVAMDFAAAQPGEKVWVAPQPEGPRPHIFPYSRSGSRNGAGRGGSEPSERAVSE